MAGNTSRAGATATSRVLALLGAFDSDHKSLTLSELARRSGLPLSTAHRVAGELVAGGLLARRPDRTFTVGRRLWDLGLLAPARSGLVEVASPFLHDLFGATGATVHLAIRDGTQVLYLDRLAGSASVPVVSTVGSRLPMHATGVGKVLLAHAPDAVRRAALSDLPRVTPYTVVHPGRLTGQLERVRRDGYAQTSEEMSLGACSVAAPVRATSGEVVAALGVVVADLRSRARLIAALTVAARGIGRGL
jgi:DNA-binding IclR family transcriptional regulator